MEVAIYALNKVNPFFKIFSIFLIWFSLGEQIIIEQNVTWYELLVVLWPPAAASNYSPSRLPEDLDTGHQNISTQSIFLTFCILLFSHQL